MSRRGFTLVELLVVIAIIAILAGFVLGALFLSQETAKATRTERTITVLNNALMDEWESYRTRRLPLRKGYTLSAGAEVVLNPHPTTGLSQETDQQFLYRRLTSLRQLMRMEMPDRYEDLFFTPTIAEPALRKAYVRKLNTFLAKYNAANSTSLTAAQYADLIEVEHESAECLYLIMTSGADIESRVQLKSRDVGDFDKDGMPEVLDGWGRPIHFLRWAPGFVSDLQPDADTSTAGVDRDALNLHDQFDPLKMDLPPSRGQPPTIGTETAPTVWGFALTPLIFSAGPDGEYGIYEMRQLGNNASFGPKNNNPYSYYDNGVSLIWRGQFDDTNGTVHLDNIHNHFLGKR